MRLFVAVDVPGQLKARIESEVVEPLRPAVAGARWTRPEGRHLTLKFLGHVDDARVDEIAAVVEETASRHAPLRTCFDELGGFPNLRRPRVLWIGLGEGNDQLAEIATDLEERFVRLGFPAEDRPFRGHFTLARFPKPSPIDVPPVKVPDEAFAIGELVLFESTLHPKGARYAAIERFALVP